MFCAAVSINYEFFEGSRFLLYAIAQCKKQTEDYNKTESIVCTVHFKFHEYKFQANIFILDSQRYVLRVLCFEIDTFTTNMQL